MLTFLRFLLRLLFGFRAFNQTVLSTPGPVLLLPNHVSWIDWLFLGVCLDSDWRFVTSSVTAQTSPIHRFIMVSRRTFPVDPLSPYAAKRMAEYLLSGGRLVLFPEGRMSRTGALMKLYDGTGFLLHKTGAKVITVYLRGAHRLLASPNKDAKEWFPRISAHFSKVLAPPRVENDTTAHARLLLTNWLRDRLVEQQFEVEMEFGPDNVAAAIVETARRRPGHLAVRDVQKSLTYGRLLKAAALLAREWKRLGLAGADSNGQTPNRGNQNGQGARHSVDRIGVLLPNMNAMPVTLLSLWSIGRVPAILNYTTGSAIMRICCELAGLKEIITSRAFIERARLDVTPLESAGIRLIYLEEVRARIGAIAKLGAGIGWVQLPVFSRGTTNDPAVILFTSGSEGIPKGVELSHRNLLANARQMLAVCDLNDHDRFFNALPLFHCFGLTGGLLLPLVRGAGVILYPSPLHYRVVPTVLYDRDCTVFLATNTFLNGYARRAHPLDFRSLRYLFAGAEKVQEATAALWAQRFGVRILEGYGATECSPAISLNTPLMPKHGSAGRLMPGMEYRLEPVEGLTELPIADCRLPIEKSGETAVQLPGSYTTSRGGNSQSAIHTGRLFVRGPNVMRGYLNPDANAKFQSLHGWYDTGDIVSVDAEGFLRIEGRLKRFAKISGEMVSLTAVEDALAGAFPEFGMRCQVVVIARPDEEKGERLVAVTNEQRLTPEQIRAAIKAKGLSNLCVPREIETVREIPKLGTGKVNHRELERQMAEKPDKLREL